MEETIPIRQRTGMVSKPEILSILRWLISSTVTFFAPQSSLRLASHTSRPMQSSPSRDTRDFIALVLRKPEIAIGSSGDPAWVAARCWDGKFGEPTTGGHAPDLVPTTLSKPEVTIGSSDDPSWPALGCWDGKFGERTAGGDAPDLVASEPGKPEIVIGSNGDTDCVGARWWNEKFGEPPAEGHTPDIFVFRKPESAIGSGDDPAYRALRDGDGKFGDDSGCGRRWNRKRERRRGRGLGCCSRTGMDLRGGWARVVDCACRP